MAIGEALVLGDLRARGDRASRARSRSSRSAHMSAIEVRRFDTRALRGSRGMRGRAGGHNLPGRGAMALMERGGKGRSAGMMSSLIGEDRDVERFRGGARAASVSSSIACPSSRTPSPGRWDVSNGNAFAPSTWARVGPVDRSGSGG